MNATTTRLATIMKMSMEKKKVTINNATPMIQATTRPNHVLDSKEKW